MLVKKSDFPGHLEKLGWALPSLRTVSGLGSRLWGCLQQGKKLYPIGIHVPSVSFCLQRQ